MPYELSRLLKLAATLVFAAIGLAPQVFAQAYPDKPVKVLMPWQDGFPANATRLYAKELADRYRQPFVVDVRAGAGGELAARQIIQSAADGYSLLSTGSSITIRSVTDANNADSERDLTPIAQLVTTPYVLVARAGKYGSFKGFIDAARAQPGSINFASAGVGTGMHYLGELLNVNAGIHIVHVPYSTGSRQLQAVLAGDVQIAIISLVTALPQINAGQLEALAVSSHRRSRVAPGVPTLREAGIAGVPDIGAWIALFGPKNLPPAVVKSLSEQIAAIAADPAVAKTVASWGAEIPDTRASYLEEIIRAEKTTWARLVKEKNLATGN
ncbi:MAG: tripartite tricarboxylate transporter substrate binding protein [Burkholderiales bacterium]|nr:tripartite tricarboxylate transporter substrate binding protein [Burkholderiales bacterium]